MTDGRLCVRVASTGDVPDGEGRVFEVNGRQVAVFNSRGTFYAIDNTCEHQGGPLAEGELDGNVVTCPWHGWTYDITSARHLTIRIPRSRSLRSRVDGSEILVAV